MTTQPLAAIFGDHSLDTAPPADIRQMSMPVKSKVSRSFISASRRRTTPRCPAAARGERHHLVGGETALAEDGQHLAAHIAGGADDATL